jgi:uncharacterized protein (TIGR03435 family)
MGRIAVVLVCLLVVLGVQSHAQAPQALPIEQSRFDVASIKPVSAGSTFGGYRPEPMRFSGDFTVIEAMNLAYQVPSNRIVDGPEWARSQRYEINATNSAPRRPEEVWHMMRHLLEERFALKVHRERRPRPVYVLSMARSDGRLGPKAQRVERDCSSPVADIRRCSKGFGPGSYRSSGLEWSAFVTNDLEAMVGRPVVDKTGLSGQFDITLEYNPNISRIPESSINPPTLAELEGRPALFTALQEQLGLKLEAGTEPIDVLVIDAVERPTPD